MGLPRENAQLPFLPGYYVRPDLNQTTMGWIADLVKANNFASKFTWKWTLNNPSNLNKYPDPTHPDPDSGIWNVEIRIDVTTPRTALDLHGGCPHAQITMLRMDNGRNINAKEPEDSHVLVDTENDNEIWLLCYPDPAQPATALSQPLLRWFATRILAREAFSMFQQVDAVINALEPVQGEQRRRNTA